MHKVSITLLRLTDENRRRHRYYVENVYLSYQESLRKVQLRCDWHISPNTPSIAWRRSRQRRPVMSENSRTSCEFRLTAQVFISSECAGLVRAMTWWNYKSHKWVVNLWNSWRSCFLKGWIGRREEWGGGTVAYWQIHCLSHNKAILSYRTGALILLTHSAFKASLKTLSFLSGVLMAPNTKELINLQVSVLTMLWGKHFVWSFSRNNPWETTLGEKYLK